MLAPKGASPAAQAFLLGMFVLAPIMLGYAGLCRIFPSLRQLDRTPWALPFFLAPSVYLGVGMYLKEKRRRAKNPDLESGVAEMTTYEATRAIRVDEFEDEGIGFYLDLGGGQALFLQGQYLYEDDEAKRFPCARFTITRTSRSHLLLDLTCTGEYLPPVWVNPPFTARPYKTGAVPEDGEILETEFENLRKRGG